MQILIEIPDELYENCIFMKDRQKYQIEHTGAFTTRSLFEMQLVNCVVSGTPLPKGHGRLIDADELKYKINSFDNNVMEEDWYSLYDAVMTDIDNAPTIIEADKEREE